MRRQLATTFVVTQMLAQAASAEMPARSSVDQTVHKWCAANFPKEWSSQSKCLKINKKGYEDFVSSKSKSKPILLNSYDLCQAEFGNDGHWDVAFYCVNQHIGGHALFESLKASAPLGMLADIDKCADDFGKSGDWDKVSSCAFDVRYGPADAEKVN